MYRKYKKRQPTQNDVQILNTTNYLNNKKTALYNKYLLVIINWLDMI